MRPRTWVPGKQPSSFDSSEIHHPHRPDPHGALVPTHDLRTGKERAQVYITYGEWVIIGRTKGWIKEGQVVV